MPLPFEQPMFTGSTATQEAILGLPQLDPNVAPGPPQTPAAAPLPNLPPVSPGAPIAAPAGAQPGAGPIAGPSRVDQIIQMLLQAAPGFALGAAGARGGIAGAGAVASGISSGLAQRQEQLARERAFAMDERQQTFQEGQVAAQQANQLAAAKQQKLTAVGGILDRARDDAAQFEGSPEAFADWKQQVRAQLDQWGAGELADTLRFPNARFLTAAAKEDRDWWDLTVKQHYERLTGGSPEDFEAVMNLTRYSPVRGRSITLKEAAASIGLADEEGNVRAPRKASGISGYVRVPTGRKGEYTYKPAEDVIGQTFREDPKDEPRERPRQGPSQKFINKKTGEVELVQTDETGKTTRIRVPASEGFEPVGGGPNAMDALMQLLGGGGGDALPATTTPATPPRKAAAVGERRRFPDGIRTWNGTSWVRD